MNFHAFPTIRERRMKGEQKESMALNKEKWEQIEKTQWGHLLGLTLEKHWGLK